MAQHINDVCRGAALFAPMLPAVAAWVNQQQHGRFRPNHLPEAQQHLCPLSDSPKSGFKQLFQEDTPAISGKTLLLDRVG